MSDKPQKTANKKSFPLVKEIFGKLRYLTLILGVVVVSAIAVFWIQTGDPVEGINKLLKAITDFFNNLSCGGK